MFPLGVGGSVNLCPSPLGVVSLPTAVLVSTVVADDCSGRVTPLATHTMQLGLWEESTSCYYRYQLLLSL